MTRPREVAIAMQCDVIANRLLEIARRHVKLALEHGHINTGLDRRKAIQGEIERLRAERDNILKSFEQERS